MDITQEVVESFRAAHSGPWPDYSIELALCEGDVETGGKGWGQYEDECHNFKQRGMFLYAAHWLSVTYPNGGEPQSSTAKSQVAAKSVGDESITYAVATPDKISGDSWLASTSFGQQFIRLRRRAGAGALAV